MTELNGTYKIYIDGKLVSTSKNIITNGGKETIKQFLAGNIPSWSGAIAIGPINTSASATDTKLGFEVDRQATLTRTVDNSGNIVLRAAFPITLETRVREIGVYPFVNTTANGRYQDTVITDFSESTWTAGGLDATATSYVGLKNVKLDSTNTSSTLAGVDIDISGYSETDKFELLVNNLDANAKTITLAFSDGTNTSTVTFPNLAASSGLQSVSVNIGSTSVERITSITLSSTNTNKSVSLDCLKFLNTDQSGYTMNLVSRSVATEIVKIAGQDLEIEYILAGL